MASKFQDHPTNLAALAGARLVSASETEDGRAWAVGLIKQLTGGETIRVRFMRKDTFEYKPIFKLMLIGNHAPVIKNVDEAIRRRYRVIPFMFKPQNPDKKLSEKLRSEYPQILDWMIKGCLAWQKEGLTTPAKVEEYTKEYLDSNDIIKQWFEENCIQSHESYEKTASLFKNWQEYAQASNVSERTKQWLSSTLVAKFGLIKGHGSGNVAIIRGIKLKQNQSDMPEV